MKKATFESLVIEAIGEIIPKAEVYREKQLTKYNAEKNTISWDEISREEKGLHR